MSNASSADAEAAIKSTVDAAVVMGAYRPTPAIMCCKRLRRLYDRREEFARLMTAEAGKPIADAKRE